MRPGRFVLRSVMSLVMLMARHRSRGLRTVDMAEEPDRRQRALEGQQERDQQQQTGKALHQATKIITPLPILLARSLISPSTQRAARLISRRRSGCAECVEDEPADLPFRLGGFGAAADEPGVGGDGHADEDVVGQVGRGFSYLLDSLNPERVLVAGEAIGIGRVALERAAAYARERVVFGRPIGQNQGVAHPLALAWARLEGAWQLTLRAAWLVDQGEPCGAEANAAKVLGAEAGFEAADAALQTFGGFGYAKEFDVERLWREVRLYKIAPVSQQMALNYLAERVLGLPKSY